VHQTPGGGARAPVPHAWRRHCRGFVDIALNFWGEIPRKPHLGGVNRFFKPNWRNIESFTLSKLLHRFQPNFAQRQRPPSGHRGWSQYVPSKFKMADGRHFAKSVKSPHLCKLLTDFDEIWQDDAHWSLTAVRSLKFRIFKNQRWRRPTS